MSTTLIIPGRNGSGARHWQSWIESRIPGARRVRGIDWERPAIHAWAGAIVHEIDQTAGEVWLVAHSFGVLAALLAGKRLGADVGVGGGREGGGARGVAPQGSADGGLLAGRRQAQGQGRNAGGKRGRLCGFAPSSAWWQRPQ